MLNENIVDEAIDGEVFRFSDALNDKIWESDGQIKRKVKDGLEGIVGEYIKFLKLPAGTAVTDVTVTGSLAGYNYSKYSDLDVHVIVDYTKISTNKEFVAEYMGAKRKLWAETNEITVMGYPLEMYAQDVAEYLEGPSPQYSLFTDKWLKRMDPHKPSVDRATVLKKARELASQIDRLEGNFHYEEVLEKTHELSGKIKRMRQEGIAEDGEFSAENLIFKALRNGGYLEKLTALREKALTNQYTIDN